MMLLLVFLSVAACDVSLVGRTGQSATLPCNYDRKHHGALIVCWGRGQIPSRGCSNRLISSDGNMWTPVSSRYQLLGQLGEGDVSMTILNLTEEDAGRYGCRVEIPGWFNDQTEQLKLTVTAGDISTTFTATTGQTGSDVTATEMWVTSVQQQGNDLQVHIGNTVRLFIIFIGILALLLTAAFRLWRRDQRLKSDSRMNQSEDEEDRTM